MKTTAVSRIELFVDCSRHIAIISSINRTSANENSLLLLLLVDE